MPSEARAATRSATRFLSASISACLWAPAWARRAANDNLEIYRIALNMPLPAIRIPLRASDDDVPLQLQPLIEQCYANGDYDGDLDYARELDPALNGADKRWADALLRKAGRRKARRGGSRAKGGGKG